MPGGWNEAAGGFPAMQGNVAFPMKDVVLLAVSVYLLNGPSVWSLVPAASVPHSLTLMVVSTYRQQGACSTRLAVMGGTLRAIQPKTTALHLPLEYMSGTQRGFV